MSLCGTLPGVRLPLALLALLSACDQVASPTGDPEPRDPEPTARRDIDRGMVLTRPTTPLPATLGLEVPEETPPPEPTPDIFSMEGLEAEVRARLPEHRLACTRVKRLRCRGIGDLDGDGAKDVVALVEPVGKRSLGLAILWAHGGVDLLGAGRRGQRWFVRFEETSKLDPIPADLSDTARWDVWSADGPEGDRRGFVDPRKRRFKAPGVRGDGIMLDGGDSATVAYHDGKLWRLEYLGF